MTEENEKRVVMINVFTVAAHNQAKLLTLLETATRESIARASGFLGAKLYRSLDGTKVTMHAQWRSAEAYASMRRTGGSEQILAEALKISEFSPGMYELVESFDSVADERNR